MEAEDCQACGDQAGIENAIYDKEGRKMSRAEKVQHNLAEQNKTGGFKINHKESMSLDRKKKEKGKNCKC